MKSFTMIAMETLIQGAVPGQAAMDAGIVSQNVNLFSAGAGLVTRPLASMDPVGLRKLLRLTDNQYPLLNNPAGYPAE